MTSTIEFKTTKGATVILTANIGVSAEVVGRPDLSFSFVELQHDRALGLMVSMGPIKAVIAESDKVKVSAFFATEDEARKLRAKEYISSKAHKEDVFRQKFYARNSDY